MPPRLPIPKLSFRQQVLVLGGLVAVLFLSVLFAAFAALRYTKFSVLTDEKKNLLKTTGALAQEYSDKAESAQRNDEAPPLDIPSSEFSNGVLTLLSRIVLQNADGVEGGFYSSTTDTLLGDSFSKKEPRDAANQDSESKERVAVLQVAREAVQLRQPSERALVTPRDIVLIEAVPIRDARKVPGSAWTLKRLPSLPGSNRYRAYLT
ncbi:MAG: hypothetical protein WB723_21710, partial [Candidatus Acidiferrales bacterium]